MSIPADLLDTIGATCDADLHTWIAALMHNPAGIRGDFTIGDLERYAATVKDEPQTLRLQAQS